VKKQLRMIYEEIKVIVIIFISQDFFMKP